MDTQLFLTYLIEFIFLSSITLFLLDLTLFLVHSWQQLSPSLPSDFYQQVKDAFRNDDIQLVLSST